MKNEREQLNNESLEQFKHWIGLNLNSISWEGRNLEAFSQFWVELFQPGVDIDEQFFKFKSLKKLMNQGPIITWFDWLEEKFITYLYVYEDKNILELSNYSLHNPSRISLVLRDFFADRIPHLEAEINCDFQLSNNISPALRLRFSDIKEKYNYDDNIKGSGEEEVMTALEVTLYDDWKKIYSEICLKPKNKIKKRALKDKNSISRNLKFIKELIILFILGGMFIFLVKVGNKAYENYLVEKISLFSPSFFWLDKNISFKSNVVDVEDIEISQNQLAELEKLEAKQVFADTTTTSRFEVESDVVLTSVDTLPKDFAVAGFEQSDYEEKRKGGYRNNRYGRRKAYRVMMSSVKPEVIKILVGQMLDEYGIKQVDNVKPGTEIPGGIYFNLFVPRNELKRFLKQVSSFEDESTILESKTVFGGPKGMDKVFVWIKSI